jgi:hypothetical protein
MVEEQNTKGKRKFAIQEAFLSLKESGDGYWLLNETF